jgi:DNA mismatch endonuclease (patch repair protein)
MADVFDRETRSRVMSRIRGKNTKPELALAMFFVRNGIGGFRRNYPGLPGKPDFVFEDKGTVVFYNSLFWHCRNILKILRMKPFWRRKLLRNWVRDVRVNFRLRRIGYNIITIWGNEYKNQEVLRRKFSSLL